MIRRILGAFALTTAITGLALGMSVVVAHAATTYPNPTPPSTATIVTTPPAPASSATATNTSSLPFTGGDVAGLAAIGAGALGLGTVLYRRARPART